jgi:aminoglycoside phosphotransferase (APT) family kinase protein
LAHPHDPDPREVLSSLGFDVVAGVEALLGGMDTQLWRFEANGTYVLRLFRREQAEVAAKEAAVMRLLRRRGYPVPHVHLLGAWRQRPALVMDWVEGETFSAALEANPRQAGVLGERFGRNQARLHALRPTASELPEELRASDRRWIAWSHPDETALRDALRALPPKPPALLHLDYHPMNALIDRGRVTAVLDWANVQLGDPRADLARTESILVLTPLRGATGGAVRNRFVAGWRRGYEGLLGSMGDLSLFRAWAGSAMLADLLPHRDTRGFPDAFFAEATCWMERWKGEAGVV